jgi:DNA-directed RNA polymerase subunit RPC12/RpoP
MTETLMVACRHCSRAFATPWQVDRATLEALVVTETYRCPRCGRTGTYVKADHFHRLVVDDDEE